MFSSQLFWEEDIAEPSRLLSGCGDVPVSALQGFADPVVHLVPPDMDRIVWFDNNELALMDSRIGEVSVLSREICDPSIHSDTLNVGISDGDTEWLLPLALFRDTMLLVHDWAALSTWTGTETGYCRTITGELGWLGSINPPCDVDHFCGRDEWQIKELEVMVTHSGGDDIRFQQCACVRKTPVSVISVGMLPILID